MRRHIANLFVVMTSAVFILIFTIFYFYDWYILVGKSMLPTFQERDIVLVNTQTERFKRGDLILFDFKFKGKSIHFNKRIVGLPGDQVEAKGQQLLVNGKPFYSMANLPGRNVSDFKSVKVPQGHIFVMGDNTDQSIDSRMFGPIPMNRIIGRIDIIIFPFSRLKFL
ncbi:signal peptidase I [Lihuaxuella thermophila]|uniref:Signal peptidase I n=1 Tax=Lihuaxuella thermophila TaxID=1173111 RepID=A0A1H8IKR3_9BACL|nr:signal peptidase I [Lihuaxuella thermophila]